jgi:phage terminase large subunit-like protein
LEAFPNGTNDDQVDGSSASFNELTSGPKAVKTRTIAWG